MDCYVAAPHQIRPWRASTEYGYVICVLDADADGAAQIMQRARAAWHTHEALRSSVAIPDGMTSPVMCVEPAEPFTEFVDLASLSQVNATTLDEAFHRTRDGALTRHNHRHGGLLVGRLSPSRIALCLCCRTDHVDAGSALLLLEEICLGSSASALPFSGVAGWLAEELPEDFAAAPPATRSPARAPSFTVSRELLAQLERLGVLEQVVLSAWLALLSRVHSTSAQTVEIGTDLRSEVEDKRAVGAYWHPRTVRIDVPPQTCFAELLKRVETLGPQDVINGEVPTCGYAFIDANGLDPRLALFALDHEVGTYPLCLEVLRTREDLSFALRYDSSMRVPAEIEALSQCLAHLLGQLASCASTRIDELQLTAAQMPSQVAGERRAGSDVTFPELFAAAARQRPAAPAVRDMQGTWSYAHLDAQSQSVAIRLGERGLQRGDVVAVLLPRSRSLLAAAIGIWKAGGTFVPLDVSASTDHQASIATDAGAKLLVTTTEWSESHPLAAALETVALDPNAPTEPLSVQSSGANCSPSDRAYILYTSGSTGQPKGVELSHRGLSNYIQYAARTYRPGHGRGALVQSPVTFDLTFTTLFCPLVVGGAVLLAPDDAESPGAHWEFVRRELLEGDVSLLKVTPSYLRVLNGMLPVQRLAGATHTLVVGGEALPMRYLRPWLESAPQTRIFNEYGPTETVVGCICAEITPEHARREFAPIGTPIDNTQVLVLDRQQRPVPPGINGEIFIAGDGVGIGYRSRASVTERQFIQLPTPLSLRGYRTGDRGCLHGDGSVEFLGRLDEQLKVNGVRIEPAAIESILLADDQVTQACALKLVSDNELDRLVVAVVSRAGAADIEQKLTQRLAQQLPPLHRPHSIAVLDALPLNSNGKVDLPALTRLLTTRTARRRAGSAPRDPIQARLVEIFREVLHSPDLGVDDNFFDFGGDSIRSIAVVGQAAQCGLRFSIADLFRHPTVEQLARIVAQPALVEQVSMRPFQMVTDAERTNLPPQAVDAYPLSALQLAMIYHNEKDRAAAIYHDIFSYHIRFSPRLDLFKRAAAALVERHELLRTTFHIADYERPLQCVHAQGADILEIEDISHLDAEQQKRHVLTHFESEKQRSFDVARLPLVRLRLFVRDAATAQLTMSFHHAIIDGWSDVLLLTELFEVYQRMLDGTHTQRPPHRTRYCDFVRLEQTAIASDATRAYWRSLLADPPVVFASRDVARGRVEVIPVPVVATAASQLRELAARHSLPFKSFLLAVHLKVTAMLCGTQDVLTTMVASGRPETLDGDELIGLFINSVPVRRRLIGGTWIDLVRDTVELEAELMPHRRFPLAEIKAMLGEDCVADSLFYFTHYHIAATLQEHGVRLLELTPHEASSFRSVANFWVDPFSDELRASVALDCNVYDEARRQRIAAYYGRALQHLLDAPHAPHSQARMLEENEARLAPPPRRHAGAVTLDEQIRRCGEATPHTTACVQGDLSLDYASFNALADAIARDLATHGVAPGDRVALCAQRGVDALVALVGILRSGAVYVPLDPATPESRMRQLLADADPQLVLFGGKEFEAIRQFRRLPLMSAASRPTLECKPLASRSSLDSPAYMLYTSGSTGTPKGVVVSHAALSSFAEALDPIAARTPGRTWLALTALTFDISLLELLWTLSRGFKVVLQGEPGSFLRLPVPRSVDPQFSLFFFSSDAQTPAYPLMLAAARAADQLGFTAIWTPERHFHRFGGSFPNPALTSAALSVATHRLQIRAGSLVLPLHNTVRAAEDWAVVDRLSEGRAGIAIASGWHQEDFVLAPEAYATRRDTLLGQIRLMQQLWRGESAELEGPDGRHDISIFPQPVRGDIPLWMSAAGAPATFEMAGQLGIGILTHLLSQDEGALAENIRRYRDLAGDKAHVVLMLHTFVADTDDQARDAARLPFKQYLLSSIDLARSASAAAASEGADLADVEALVERAVDRYLDSASFIGSLDTCLARATRLRELGIDEFACLVDFGVESDALLEAIPRIDALRLALTCRERSQCSVFENIERHRVTHLQCTPTVLRELISDPRAAGALSGLEILLVGGEVLPQWLAERARGFGPSHLYNMYGPTEATIWCAADEFADGTVTIGHALANSALYVLAQDGTPTPFDTPGEIHIGGPGLADGYWRRPDLTAGAFIDSALIEPGRPTRLYRTGDLGARLADGRIQFLGRADRQVKIAGNRLELGEVEHIARTCPGVRDCIALVSDAGTLQLAVLGDPHVLSAQEVLVFLRQHLPAPALPRQIVVLESLPKNASGKLHAVQLQSLFDTRVEARPGNVPQTATQRGIAEAWKETLGVAPAHIDQDFFACGGNSLRAMVMVAHLRRAFGTTLGVRTLFEHPTIEALARLLDSEATSPHPTVTPAVTGFDATALSIWQERLWMIDRIAPGKAAYNDAVLARVLGAIDPERTREVIRRIVLRHDSLRATFHDRDGVPYARYDTEGTFDYTFVDFTSHGEPGAVRESALDMARQIGSRPFDLASGPLLRVALLRLSPTEGLLLVVLHHIIGDGWSLSILLREFAELYADMQRTLPPAPRYAALAATQRAAQSAERKAMLSAFWRNQLAELPAPLELPLDFRRPAAEEFLGATASVHFEAHLTEQLAVLGQRHGATLYMVLAAGFAAALQRLTGRDEILLGTDVANRAEIEAQSAIGLFVNQIVLRFDLTGSPDFSTLLARVRASALDAYEHQDHPFNVLVDEISPARDLSRNPIYQIAFTLQEAAQGQDTGSVTVAPIPFDLGTSRLDLEVNARRDATGLVVEARYNSHLYRPFVIDQLLRGYQLLLEHALRDPAAAIRNLCFFDNAQRNLLTHGLNQTTIQYPQTSMMELLAARAAAVPESIAITSGTTQIACDELTRRVNALAIALMAQNIGRGDIVGVVLPRSPSLIMAILALWRVGAVYMPLDPAQPAARSSAMMRQAGARHLIAASATHAAATTLAHDSGARMLDETALLAAGLAMDVSALPTFTYPHDHPAYVLFTSGSTGVPKGAVVLHQGMMNHLQAKIADLGLSAKDAVAQTAPQTFDISIWQMLAPLACGGRLVFVDDDTAQTPASLGELIETEGITIVELVPTLLELLWSACRLRPNSLRTLRWMISTGEALPVVLCRRWLHDFPGIPLMNAYGPTECSDDVTHHCIYQLPSEQEIYIPIGKPIGNVRLYVVDEQLNLLPIGAAGELLVAGVCVGAGYINDREATDKAFIDDPFETASAYRAYRTGDLVRRRADGTIDYLGRIDHQIKIGGCRIELGEIEAALESHPLVRRGVATLVEHTGTGKRLCAYAVPDWPAVEERTAADERQRRTAEWQSIYDYYYAETAPASGIDIRFDTRGWNDSYTRSPFPDQEMREWLNQTVAKIRSLRARRILEIGCGSGMLLFALAGDCERYAGIDLSPEIAARLRTNLQSEEPSWDHVTVDAADAHDLSCVAHEAFDLVILNSVVQYFPTADYLTRTLQLAASKLRPGGSIFIGDVRCLELAPLLHRSIRIAGSSTAASASELDAAVSKAMSAENELLLSAEYFQQLAREAFSGRHAQTCFWLRHGEVNNELFRYRFDTALRFDIDRTPEPAHRLHWSGQSGDLGELLDSFDTHRGPVLLLGVPNHRLHEEALFAGHTEHAITAEGTAALLSMSLDGWQVQTRVNETDPYCFDALLHRGPAQWPSAPQTQRVVHNNPLHARASAVLIDELQPWLASRLPSHMVPGSIMVLEDLPLSRNGKIARQALPVPVHSQQLGAQDHPRTATEAALCEIWAELLGIEAVGIRANFFELGGDSILGIQMVARAGRRGLRFTARQIFEHQTIAELAAVATSPATSTADEEDAIAEIPLAPIQHALFAQTLSVPEHWNQALVLQLTSEFTVGQLRQAMQLLAGQHDALRFRYRRASDGSWHQSGTADVSIPIEEVTLPSSQWRAYADHSNTRLSLESGPLLRGALVTFTDRAGSFLLLVAHHLIIDAVSWRILLDDLGDLLRAPQMTPALLGSRTQSYRRWVEHQIRLAESRVAREHLSFWLEQHRSSVHTTLWPAWPGTVGGVGTSNHSTVLDFEITRTLVQLSGDSEATMEALLLASLAVAVDAVLQRSDVVVWREGHGRDAFDDLDVSRTVGWFTAMCPMRLRVPRSKDTTDTLDAVVQSLRAIRQREWTYGVLRYLDPDPQIRAAFAERPDAEIAFNYFGHLSSAATGTLHVANEYSGAVRSERDKALTACELNAGLRDGRLELHCHYHDGVIDTASVRRLCAQIERTLQAFAAQATDLSRRFHTRRPVARDVSPELLDAALQEISL